jgi:CheY-like chemotaxis protein/HPt (histidine-containing phosphotransfer) domain-containing protein
MTLIRILHVDDEPDIREVAEIALGFDPGFTVRSCDSGKDALTVADGWQPDIILLDVMMPVMDGPTTLIRLRDNPNTAGIPVIFMTARAQTRELDRFRSLGAIGVIPKPFDPMTLAASVRSYLRPAKNPLDELIKGFLRRVERDVAELSADRLALTDGRRIPGTLDRMKSLAHGLSGAGGIYGFAEISDAAAALEDALINELTGPGFCKQTDVALDGLIVHAERCKESRSEPMQSLR